MDTDFPVMNPNTFKHRILVLVSGMSPQIVTESLYALRVKGQETFQVNRVVLITTAEGKRSAELSLLKGERHFSRFCADYGIGDIRFDESDIHVITTPQGQPLADIRSPAENELAANFITEQLRELTGDPECALHVSLAGGRKTMGFYMGYALSLFGRPQDRLSHVLVSEGFETHREFFYPTPVSRVIYNRDGRPLDAQAAEVTLAYIPFVRLRDNLPPHLLAEQTTFGEAVRWSNLANNRGNSLKVDLGLGLVWAHGQELRLNKTDLAFLMLFVDDVLNGDAGVLAPPKKKDERQDEELSTGLKTRFLDWLEALSPGGVEHRTAEALEDGLFGNYFDVRLSNIRKELVAVLGARLAQHYLPLRVAERKSKGGRMAGVYRLGVSGGEIEVIGRKMNDD